ncbi:carboxymuconolactone decarboxylase family protein [Halovulum sp. GXIMD14794]
MTSESTFDPIPDDAWPESVADLRDGFAGRLNVYRTMAHHPELLRSWAPLREHVVNQTSLGPEFSEVAILRTGHRLGSSYELNQHIERARRRGLDDSRIAAILGPVDAMSAPDRLVSTAVDELFETARLSKTVVEDLSRRFGNTAIFDLFATVGFYSTLGFILNTFDTPLDEDIAERLRRDPLDLSKNSPRG